MTSHNPLRPKSSLLEQKAKSRSGLQMVMIIVAVHVVFLGGLLFSGCRPENPVPEPAPGPDAIPVLPPDGGGVASPPGETNTVTVVEAPAAPPLPDATTSEPKPPPVTRDTEPVEDIVPLIPEPSEGPEVPVAAGEIEYVVAKPATISPTSPAGTASLSRPLSRPTRRWIRTACKLARC